MILHLRGRMLSIFSVFAKAYSIDPSVLSHLKQSGFTVIEMSYKTLDNTDFLQNHLKEAASAVFKER